MRTPPPPPVLQSKMRSTELSQSVSRFFQPVSVALAVALSLAICGCERAEQDPARLRPDIFLITVDGLRWDHLSGNGYSRSTTPFLDRWSATAVAFRQANAAACSSTMSHRALLSGAIPQKHETRNARQTTPLPWLPTILKAHGYQTKAVVSHPDVGADQEFDAGFDQFIQIFDESEETPGNERPRALAEKTARGALSQIANLTEAPAFCWFHFADLRPPFKPGARFDERFVGDGSFSGDQTLPIAPAAEGANEPWQSYEALNPALVVGEEQRVDYYVAQYDAAIRTVDEQIERLVTALDKRKNHDPILVIVGAHGLSLGEHGYYFDHRIVPYDVNLRVPMFLQWPGVEPGREVDAIVSLTDLLPTLAKGLAIDVNEVMDGHELVGVLRGEEELASPFVCSAGDDRRDSIWSIRGQRWKLLWAQDAIDQEWLDGAEFQLFDIATDPLETLNVASQEPDTLGILHRALQREANFVKEELGDRNRRQDRPQKRRRDREGDSR